MYGSIDHKVERLISNNVDMPVQACPISGKMSMQCAIGMGMSVERISNNVDDGVGVYEARQSCRDSSLQLSVSTPFPSSKELSWIGQLTIR
jgi:hypothetical protein